MPKEKAGGKPFNPEKYHMNFCHECHGRGRTINQENSKEVCQVCGGFGLIKDREWSQSTPDPWPQGPSGT